MIALAALAMVLEDIAAVCLVQAEARDRAMLSGVLDSVCWLLGILVSFTTITTLQGHHVSAKVAVICAVTLANFVGSLLGVQIGRRLIKSRASLEAAGKEGHA